MIYEQRTKTSSARSVVKAARDNNYLDFSRNLFLFNRRMDNNGNIKMNALTAYQRTKILTPKGNPMSRKFMRKLNFARDNFQTAYVRMFILGAIALTESHAKNDYLNKILKEVENGK